MLHPQDVLPLYSEFWERYADVGFTTHPEKYLRWAGPGVVPGLRPQAPVANASSKVVQEGVQSGEPYLLRRALHHASGNNLRRAVSGDVLGAVLGGRVSRGPSAQLVAHACQPSHTALCGCNRRVVCATAAGVRDCCPHLRPGGDRCQLPAAPQPLHSVDTRLQHY